MREAIGWLLLTLASSIDALAVGPQAWAARPFISGVAGVDHVAFRNEDDGSRVLFVANAETRPARFAVREGRKALALSLPAESVATLVLP